MSQEATTDTTTPALTEHQIKVLLVDDQAIIGEAVRRMLAEETDIVLHYCGDPNQALAVAEELEPTLILQDLVMPDIDGLTLVKTFRSTPKTQDVPMIVLSSKEEPKTKAEAFALGANDYLVKLPDKIELIARIRYHSTGYINLLQRNEAFEALTRSQQALAGELAEAADYVRSILPEPVAEGEITTDWKFITSSSLGGDAFGYHWLDDDHFVLYLLDVCGHGVGAALLSVSAMNIITGGTLPDVDFLQPASVVEALNLTFPMEKQNNMYFTMWYGVYHRPTRALTYASAGHPPALLIGKDGSVTNMRTPAMPVGTLLSLKFHQETITVPEGATIYVFSDGAYEIKRPDGSMMEVEDLAEILRKPCPADTSMLDHVLCTVRAEQGRDDFVDDFSIVECRFK